VPTAVGQNVCETIPNSFPKQARVLVNLLPGWQNGGQSRIQGYKKEQQ